MTDLILRLVVNFHLTSVLEVADLLDSELDSANLEDVLLLYFIVLYTLDCNQKLTTFSLLSFKLRTTRYMFSVKFISPGDCCPGALMSSSFFRLQLALSK